VKVKVREKSAVLVQHAPDGVKGTLGYRVGKVDPAGNQGKNRNARSTDLGVLRLHCEPPERTITFKAEPTESMMAPRTDSPAWGVTRPMPMAANSETKGEMDAGAGEILLASMGALTMKW
jgi:hypothetical protein